MVVAAIGHLSDTLEDRSSIIIHMRRKCPELSGPRNCSLPHTKESASSISRVGCGRSSTWAKATKSFGAVFGRHPQHWSRESLDSDRGGNLMPEHRSNHVIMREKVASNSAIKKLRLTSR